ncbi:DUF4258 domain-containing protein [Candidatus Woesearchaeota archaeon]|nr:DUF4258 domain-containing protein [Candidatus Woesearchaeota archaeon]
MEIHLKITKHAKERMALHGITLEQVKRAIQQGAKTKQTEGYLASYVYLKVAYREIGEKYYKIKTVFIK